MMGLEGYMESSGKPKLLIHAHRHNLKTRFELIKTLGEGTYGKVKLAVEKKTGEQVAIKYIKKNKIKDDTDLNRIQREIRIMSSLCHPYIINVREVFENKERIILIMDCATGGELYEYINDQVKLTEKDARRIFRQIVSAICYCHQNGIVHRDLKLENIVLDEQQNVKIADFGLSNYYSTNDLLSTFCGSPLYASPEIVNGQAYHGPEVDCWSLGVVLYTLVYGTMPFDSTDFPTLKRQISCGDYYEPAQASEAAGLIRHLLTVNPQKRAKMNDILNHWWVNLGFKQNPNDEPYPVPELFKPTSLRMSHVTSSDNESDVEQTHASQPLKGILKKPKSFGSEKESTNQHKEPLSRHRNNCSDNMQTLEKGPELKCDPENNCEKMLDSENNEEKVFDSERKPVRGILKWTGRFTAPGEVKGKVKSMRENLNARRQRDCNDPPNNPKMPDISGADLTQILHQEHSTDNDNAAQHSTTNKASGTSSVILQKRNLRKTSQTDDRKRLSACSLGSNSSAEILDFSYDSSDENCLSITNCLTPNTETTGNGLKGFDICDGFGMEDQCQSLEDEMMRKNSADSSVFDPEEARLVLAQALSIRDKNCR